MIEYQVRFLVGWDGKLPPFDRVNFNWCVTVSAPGALYANLYIAKPTRKQIRNDIKKAKKMGSN